MQGVCCEPEAMLRVCAGCDARWYAHVEVRTSCLTTHCAFFATSSHGVPANRCCYNGGFSTRDWNVYVLSLMYKSVVDVNGFISLLLTSPPSSRSSHNTAVSALLKVAACAECTTSLVNSIYETHCSLVADYDVTAHTMAPLACILERNGAAAVPCYAPASRLGRLRVRT